MGGAPADYVELYEQYRGFVTALVRSRRFKHLNWAYLPAQDVADVTSEILARVFEQDGLALYDPAEGSFKAYLAGFAYRLLPGLADKILLRYVWRYRFVGLAEDVQWFMDAAPDCADQVCDEAAVDDLIGRVRRRLLDGPTQKVWTSSLVEFFDQVVAQARRRGRVDLAELTRVLGCSVTAANTRMWKIRVAFCEELGLPVPAKQTSGPAAGSPRPVRAKPDPWAPARSAAVRLARLVQEYEG